MADVVGRLLQEAAMPRQDGAAQVRTEAGTPEHVLALARAVALSQSLSADPVATGIQLDQLRHAVDALPASPFRDRAEQFTATVQDAADDRATGAPIPDAPERIASSLAALAHVAEDPEGAAAAEVRALSSAAADAATAVGAQVRLFMEANLANADQWSALGSASVGTTADQVLEAARLQQGFDAGARAMLDAYTGDLAELRDDVRQLAAAAGSLPEGDPERVRAEAVVSLAHQVDQAAGQFRADSYRLAEAQQDLREVSRDHPPGSPEVHAATRLVIERAEAVTQDNAVLTRLTDDLAVVGANPYDGDHAASPADEHPSTGGAPGIAREWDDKPGGEHPAGPGPATGIAREWDEPTDADSDGRGSPFATSSAAASSADDGGSAFASPGEGGAAFATPDDGGAAFATSDQGSASAPDDGLPPEMT